MSKTLYANPETDQKAKKFMSLLEEISSKEEGRLENLAKAEELLYTFPDVKKDWDFLFKLYQKEYIR